MFFGAEQPLSTRWDIQVRFTNTRGSSSTEESNWNPIRISRTTKKTHIAVLEVLDCQYCWVHLDAKCASAQNNPEQSTYVQCKKRVDVRSVNQIRQSSKSARCIVSIMKLKTSQTTIIQLLLIGYIN